MRTSLPKIKALQGQYQGINFDHHFLLEKPKDVPCFETRTFWDKKDDFLNIHI